VYKIFQAAGSLLCRRLEFEWDQRRKSVDPLHKQLLPGLAIQAGAGDDTGKMWRRWAALDGKEGTFASGRREIAVEVIAWAVTRDLIDEKTGTRFDKFVQLLDDLGTGRLALVNPDLEDRVSHGYSLVFQLAGLEESGSDNCFVDLLAPNRDKISRDSYDAITLRGKVLHSGFATFDALLQLESALKVAYSIAEGNLPSTPISDQLAEQLLVAACLHDASELVDRIGQVMSCFHSPQQSVREYAERVTSKLAEEMMRRARSI